MMKKSNRYNAGLAKARKRKHRLKKKLLKKDLMTPRDIRRWQKEAGFKTQKDAADALGISVATFQDMRNGISRNSGKAVVIDKRTALACAALLHGLEPYGKNSEGKNSEE